MTRKRLSRGDEHYVNNKEFSQAVDEYAAAYREAVKKELPPPKMSNYIGSCIFSIATRMANRPNFMNYSYRDEMICDGIENAIKYLYNFDGSKAIAKGKIPNAFAYVTQIVKFAFIRRIDAEHKQQYIKEKNIEMSGIFNSYMSTQDHDDGNFGSSFNDIMSNLNNLDYDMKKKQKKLDKLNNENSTPQ